MHEQKLPVAFFQRRPRPGFDFSFEAIFADLRRRLADRIEPTVYYCSRFNDGMSTKLTNIWEAGRREEKAVNHITGEVHFLNLLLDRRRVLLTIHDCRFMSRKADNRLASWITKWLYLKLPILKSHTVTTVSETTKQDILRYTDCDPGKIVVVPVAIDAAFRPSPRSFNAAKPNILQIGTGDNKNLPRLIEALTGLPCHLTVIGRLDEEMKAALEESGIEYTNKYNISNEELVQAYEDCDLLAYVSTFEGFGMPIIEANTVERVVVTSNLSSMPEVAGDAALLVDPFDVAAIRAGIQRVIEDAELRERLLEAGRRNRQRFSPEIIAGQYYSLYREIACGA